jgi:S1-C subfamily serine protease
MSRLSATVWQFIAGISLMLLAFLGGAAWVEKTASDTRETVTPADSQATILTSSELSTIQLFEKAAPGVCFITTTNLRENFWTRDISEIKSGTGSGFIWDKMGHIVTNYHVIEGADKATVTLADQTNWPAELIGVAPEKDLAVLKIKAPIAKLYPIPVGISENLKVGQSVFAIGNPFGLDQTLTTGVVSALGREIQSRAGVPIRDAIQTDAAINPGNSGGPLLDSGGKLIGVNTAIYSPSGASAGIGFSIPIDAVRWVVPELIRYGKIQRPTLGVELASNNIVARYGLQGPLILNVPPGSNAEKSGFQPTRRNRYGEILLGDIITSIDGEVVKNNGDLYLILEKHKVGDMVEVECIRNQKKLKLKLQLEEGQ